MQSLERTAAGGGTRRVLRCVAPSDEERGDRKRRLVEVEGRPLQPFALRSHPRAGTRSGRREAGGLQRRDRVVHVAHTHRPGEDLQMVDGAHRFVRRRELYARLGRDDLEIRVCAERYESVLRPAAGVLPADLRPDARQPLERRDAFGQAADRNDEMIECRCHGRLATDYVVGSALRASRSGSFLTSHTSSSTRVSPFADVYFGQRFSPGPFGSPVFMNCTSEADIFSASLRGRAPPPVCVNMRSVLWNQKQMSTQWNAPMRLSKSGGCQANQATNTGAVCFDFASASVTTLCRLLLTTDQISTGFLPGNAFA